MKRGIGRLGVMGTDETGGVCITSRLGAQCSSKMQVRDSIPQALALCHYVSQTRAGRLRLLECNIKIGDYGVASVILTREIGLATYVLNRNNVMSCAINCFTKGHRSPPAQTNPSNERGLVELGLPKRGPFSLTRKKNGPRGARPSK